MPADDPSRAWRNRAVVGLVAAVAVALDAITKQWAVSTLTQGVSREVIGGLVRFDLSFNPGMAFSVLRSGGVVLGLVAFATIIGILWYAGRVSSPLILAGLGMICGGAAGNLVDRIFRAPGFLEGYVVDFVRLPNWPTFNVADSFLTAGVVCVFVGIFLRDHRENRRHAGNTDA